MADPHHPHHNDPIEENIDTHPVKLAIGIAVGAVALIIGIILTAQLAISSYGSRSRTNDPTMTEEAVAKRIAPVASVQVDPNAPATPAAAPAAPAATVTPVAATGAAPAPAAAPAKTADAGASGKATFESVCTVCHGTGVAGAPKFADKAAWAPRIATGKEALYTSALKGKNAMPPKGGNPALADDAVKAAVDYMVAAAK